MVVRVGYTLQPPCKLGQQQTRYVADIGGACLWLQAAAAPRARRSSLQTSSPFCPRGLRRSAVAAFAAVSGFYTLCLRRTPVVAVERAQALYSDAVQHQTQRSRSAREAHTCWWWALQLSASAGPVCGFWQLLSVHAVAVQVAMMTVIARAWHADLCEVLWVSASHARAQACVETHRPGGRLAPASSAFVTPMCLQAAAPCGAQGGLHAAAAVQVGCTATPLRC
jgi:hypothetical protein